MARLVTGIILDAKDNLTPAIHKAGRSVANFAAKGRKSLKGFQMALITINQGTQLLRSAFNVTLGPVVRVLKNATKASLDFGKAMAEVSTLVDTQTTDMAALNKATLGLAMQYGKAPIEQAKALYTSISAGAAAGAESISLMNAANMMAVGGVTQVETAVDGLTSVINAYGVGFQNAEAVSDKFFQAIKLGKTTAGELAANIGKVTTGAAAAGVSMDEMFAAIAAGTKVGLNTAMVTVGINAAITTLTKPTKDAAEVAKRLGLEFNTTRLRSIGLVGILKEVASKANLTDDDLAKLFGSVRAGRVVVALMNKNFHEINNILPQLANSTGATREAFEKMAATAGFQISRLRATFESALILAGNLVTQSSQFGTFIKGMVDGAKILVTALYNMGQGMHQSKVDLNGLGRNLILVGGRMMIMGTKTLMFLTEQFYSLATGIQIVANTFNLFSKRSRLKEINDRLQQFDRRLGAAIDNVNDAKRNLSDLVKEYGSVENAQRLAGGSLQLYTEQVVLAKENLKDILAQSDKYKKSVMGEINAARGLNASNYKASVTLGQFKDAAGDLTIALDALNSELNDPEALGKAEKSWEGVLKAVEAAKAALRTGGGTGRGTRGDEDEEKKLTERQKAAVQERAKTEYFTQLALAKSLAKLGETKLETDKAIAEARLQMLDGLGKAEIAATKKGIALAAKQAKSQEDFQKRVDEAYRKGLETRSGMEVENAARREDIERAALQFIKDQEDEKIRAIADTAAQVGQMVYNLGRQFVDDMMDNSLTTEEAFKNLAKNMLVMLAETTAQFLLTEGLKQLILTQTNEHKEMLDRKAKMSTFSRMASELAAEKVAVTAKKGLKVKETTTSLLADKAKGTGGILSFFAGLGPIGFLLAAGAIAGFVAMIVSLINSVKGFNKGGLVTGGTPGRDSVPAMLTPGEFVLTKSTVDSIRKGAAPRTPGFYANGGMVTPMSAMAGAGTVIQFSPTIQTIALPSSAENQRYMRDTVARTTARLNRNGFLG
tara:strand:+ start:1221 stop:4238 length:3018 start_codon:yes stop_codon:yes gene_type:complete